MDTEKEVDEKSWGRLSQVPSIDQGRDIDWGQTASDYAKYRARVPKSFYERLSALGIGLPHQKILDIGTGTGDLALAFAAAGCRVAGVDVAQGQIEMAKTQASQMALDVDFQVAPAETLPFTDDNFDCVTANQCFLYFDTERALQEIKRVLRPKGLLVISHFSWLPRIDAIARGSEKLILQHNPAWSAADYDGQPPPYSQLSKLGLSHCGMFVYDEPIPFSKESWRGRIRASRGVGASMSPAEVSAFDKDHSEWLDSVVDGDFTILHRLDANIFSYSGWDVAHIPPAVSE